MVFSQLFLPNVSEHSHRKVWHQASNGLRIELGIILSTRRALITNIKIASSQWPLIANLAADTSARHSLTKGLKVSSSNLKRDDVETPNLKTNLVKHLLVYVDERTQLMARVIH